MTAWTRSRNPSLASRLPTWVLTVASLTNSPSAISALLRPRASSRSTSCSRAVSEASRDGDGAVSGGGRAHRGDQIMPRRVLEQEPAGSGPERLVDVVVEVERGEHDHLGRGRSAGDQPRRLETVHPRHPDVHEHHV